MRITQVVQEYSRKGGIENVAFELQQAWRNSHVDAILLAGIAPCSEKCSDIKIVKAPFNKVATRGNLGRYFGRLLVVPFFTFAVSRYIHKLDTDDVVLSHGDTFVGNALVVHAVNRASLAAKIKNGEYKWLLNPMHWWVAFRDWYMIAGLRYQLYIAVSHRVANELKTYYKVPDNKIIVIPNGVNTERFIPVGPGRSEIRREFGISDDAKVLLFVGHEFGRKGLKPIIQALPHMDNKVNLLVIGNDNARPYIDLAKSLNVENQVHFAGQRSDLPELNRAADAFVFPTAYEAFALVCMEALACGIPSYVTRVGGVEDYIIDNENGFFIEANEESIANVLNRTLYDNDLINKVKVNARKTALTYNWSDIAVRYADALLALKA
jgi:glycosyltransferase involved in cell wall biosynthesis